MNDFKHLKKEGSEYQVKQYISFQHVIVVAWVFISDHQYQLSENRHCFAYLFIIALHCFFYSTEN